MFGINGTTKYEKIVIGQGLTENSVSEQHIIKPLLNLMLKIDKYIYTYHTNIFSSNLNKKYYSAPHTIHIYN